MQYMLVTHRNMNKMYMLCMTYTIYVDYNSTMNKKDVYKTFCINNI
jgi:hypothetical protein